MQDPNEGLKALPTDDEKNDSDSTLVILSSLMAAQVPLPVKKVHFLNSEKDAKSQECKKIYPAISNNHLCELHLAILEKNLLGVKNVLRKVGEDNFKKLLQNPSLAKYTRGYKAVHFLIEEELGHLIDFFYNVLKADFSLTIDYEQSEYYGLAPFQLAVCKSEVKVLEKFRLVPQPKLSTFLHAPCLKGKHKGCQALHIALMMCRPDMQEPGPLGEYYLQNRKLIVEMLIKEFGANYEATIDNPEHVWHGKTALKILELLKINLDGPAQSEPPKIMC